MCQFRTGIISHRTYQTTMKPYKYPQYIRSIENDSVTHFVSNLPIEESLKMILTKSRAL